jgi:hypothetical protein
MKQEATERTETRLSVISVASYSIGGPPASRTRAPCLRVMCSSTATAACRRPGVGQLDLGEPRRAIQREFQTTRRPCQER